MTFLGKYDRKPVVGGEYAGSGFSVTSWVAVVILEVGSVNDREGRFRLRSCVGRGRYDTGDVFEDQRH